MSNEKPDPNHLSAAVDALGKIMLEMQRRRLLADPKTNRKTGEMLLRDPKKLSDEQVGVLAANAFEAGAMALAAVGYPGAQVFSCSPSPVTDAGKPCELGGEE